ncbi:MAG: ABC transporter ATP-binding protein [Bacilli bacterium]|nr:ABC transporter ATP-binding protein [Bacilli bacterium]
MAIDRSAKARPKNLRKTLKHFLKYIGKHSRLLFVISILVIIPAVSQLYGTYMIKPLINTATSNGDKSELARLCLIVAGVYLTGVTSAFIYMQLIARFAQVVIYDMRRDLFNHIQELPIKYFDTHSYGEMMSSFTNDLESVTDALNNSFATLIQYFVQIVGMGVILFLFSWELSLVVLGFYFIMFAYIMYSGKKSKLYYSRQQKAMGELNGFADEILRGEKTIKSFTSEKDVIKTFINKSEELEKASASALTYGNSMVPMVVFLSYLNYGIVTVLGGLMVISGRISDIGTLSSYLIFVRQAASPINRLTGNINSLLNGLASMERVFNLINLEPEIDNGKIEIVNVDSSMNEVKEKTGYYAYKDKKQLIKFNGNVKMENAIFSYVSGKVVINDITIEGEVGEKIALVGSTGAGKTTIVNLINRFYDVDEGRVTVDGINIKDIKKDDLRSVIGMVLQETHLFYGTIEDNIKFGKLDASHEEVVAAAKLASADSFIRRLPQGYNTVLTGDGENLSSGQRQLIAIARVAISNPPILILDEATSSVDTYTEQLIQKGMDMLMVGRTTFVIAHRLSTVRNSSAIIVLENGKVLESGTHESLIKSKGKYYSLYTGKTELT